jgi:hypothetical protein
MGFRTVDINEDHIKIRYGDDPEPVALVAPGEGKTFVVQSLMKQRHLKSESAQLYEQKLRSRGEE